MKTNNPNFILSTACVAALAMLLAVTSASASSWTGGSTTTTNWSDGANWGTATPPGATDPVAFDNSGGATNAQGVVNNIVDANFTINDLTYSSLNPNYYTTLIPSGVTLTINNSAGLVNNLVVNNTAGGLLANDQVYATITGGGSLAINNPQGSMIVRQSGASGSHRATLDLSGLTLFNASVSNILEAVAPTTADDRPVATMLLAETNYITTGTDTTKPGILILRAAGTAGGGNAVLTLGTHNEINTEGLVVGGYRGSGSSPAATLGFPAGTGGNFLKIRGSGGGSSRATLISLGDNTATESGYSSTATSQSPSGTANLTGGTVDILANDLVLGRNVNATSTGTGNTGTGTGTLSYEQGTIDVNNLYIGYKVGANYGNAVGTLNLNGTAQMTVNNNVAMAYRAANGTALPNATINIAPGATMNVKGNITDTNSTGISTINLNGGLLNLMPAGDLVPGNIQVDNLNASGTISGAGAVGIATNLTLGTAVTAGTLNLAGNLFLSNAVALAFNLAAVTTTGGGVNDYLNLTGDLNLNNNALQLVPLAPLATGTYRLIDYTGAKSGAFTFSNPTRYNLTLDQATANQINLVNVGGAPLSLTWKGATASWDVNTSANWNNGAEKFYQLDSVTFDDTGLNTNVTVAATVVPSTVAVNASTNYFFTGTGKISGGASLTKGGTGILTVSTPNDYVGPTVIANGILKLGNGTALGSTNGGTTVASGGTLDVNGTSIYSPGEWITIAGTGLNNTGAVINTGSGQNNAIRFLTLSDDATVRSDNRFDVRGPGGNSSFSGVLDLGGHTLTKLGGAQMSIVDSIATNAGSIEIAGGVFSLTRSKVDGAGLIDISTNVLLLENFSTGYVAKPFVSSGGTLRVTGSAVTLGVPITNLAGLTVDNSAAVTFTNHISGAGALTKIGGSTLTLTAPNTYAGPTTVSAGNLTLSNNASLPNTPGIAVGGGATLDVSALPGGLTLASGQTLSGSGTVIGNVTAGSGTAVVPGTSAGTLTLSNNLTLNDSSSVFELAGDPAIIGGNVNDLVSVGGTLTLGGVTAIKIVPLATLNNTTPYTLFQYNNLVGGVGNLSVTSDSRYNFTPSVNASTIPPSIQVSVVGSGASANLVWHGGALANPTAWDTKTTANWLNGASPDLFYLGDNVTFDDTATTGTVTLPATVQPAAVAFNNATLGYSLSGPGAVSAGSLVKQGAGSLTLGNDGNNSFSGTVAVNEGTVNFAGPGFNTFNIGLLVAGGTANFTGPVANNFGPAIFIDGGSVVMNHPFDLTLATPLSNTVAGVAGTLVKQGANMLTLSGDSASFEGAILVGAGTLRTSRGTALGAATGGTTIASGATLDVNGQNLGGEPITVSGSGMNGNGAIVNTGGGQNNALGSVTLAGNTVFGGTGRWDIRNSPAVLSTGGNPYNITKIGGNQVSLVGVTVDSMLGNIDVQAGTFDIETTSTAGDPAKTLSVRGGASVEFYNTGTGNPINKVITLDNSSRVWSHNGNNVIGASSPVTLNGPVTFDIDSGSLEVDGNMVGAGGVTKVSGNTLILAGNNTYAAGTMISAGTLQVGAGGTTGNLPPQPGGVLTNNGTLAFNRSDDVTVNEQITGTGGLNQIGGGAVILTASNSYAGATTLNTSTTTSPSGSALRISNSYGLGTTAGNTTINGNTTGNSTLELVGNNMVIGEAFSLSARQGATVDIPHIRNVSGNNTLTGPIIGTTGGNAYNIQSDSGLLTVTGNFIPPATSGTRNLKLMGDGNGVWSGIVSNSTDGLVPALLVKQGAGTWTLSGSNVYFGATILEGGTLTLAASGSINSTPSIDVQAGTTFNVAATPGGFVLGTNQTVKGDGTVVGNFTAKGTVAPGESAVGALTFANNLVLAGTNLMEIDKLNNTNDLITAAGLTYGGALVVTEISSTSPALGDTFKLFSAPNYPGTFASMTLPALDPGFGWDTSKLSVDGTIKVIQTVSTTPTSLGVSFTGTSLDLSWPADHIGWRLEGQTNALSIGLSNDWVTVAGSVGTNRVVLPVSSANGAVFYRLVFP